MTYIIAEIGQNHNGDIHNACKMVDQLAELGVDCIKTAKRDIDVCLTEEQKNMTYDNPNSFGRTYYEHRKALELSESDFMYLKQYVESKGIDFLSSFTDKPSLQFLLDIDIKELKIASQRTTDLELLREVAKTNKKVYLSTGMCGMKDVQVAVEILKNNNPTILQCTSSYPCALHNFNLNVINTYRDTFKRPVGYSSHSGCYRDLEIAHLLGAEVLEFHYTLDREMKGTDHKVSLDFIETMQMLNGLKIQEMMLGSKEKEVLDCELPAIKKLRS